MIYLVEDEKKLGDLLYTYLKDSGYDVQVIKDGLTAFALIDKKPDLWILDIMLPGMDGYSLIKHIKEQTPDVPVIFMSARSSELDRVLGLEMGSDDYLPKPFLPRELVLRVERILKKGKTEPQTIHMGQLTLKPLSREVYYKNALMDLTLKEYDLLHYLVMNSNKALNRNEILDAVWGDDYFGSERVIDDTLRRIRKKLPDLNIQPVYGYGYILKDQNHDK